MDILLFYDSKEIAIRNDQIRKVRAIIVIWLYSDSPFIEISGYNDSTENAEGVGSIGMLRAEALKAYLVQGGIPAGHVTISNCIECISYDRIDSLFYDVAFRIAVEGFNRRCKISLNEAVI